MAGDIVIPQCARDFVRRTGIPLTDSEWLAVRPAEEREAFHRAAADGAVRTQDDEDFVLAGLVAVARAYEDGDA